MKVLSVSETENILKNTPIGEIPEKIKEFEADERKSVKNLIARYSRKYEAYQNELVRLDAMTAYEKDLRKRGFSFIAGTDEAGRGPLAGPVCAAAVILPEDCVILGLNDSKKVTAKKRDELFDEIKEKAVSYSIVMESPEVIDEINILQATYSAMKKALASLNPAADYLLADALTLSGISIPQQGIIKGDAKSVSIAAASILAKVTRDRLMTELSGIYPEYGFEKHKGYGSAEHIAALKKYGPCPIHRRSFIKNFFPEGIDENF